MSKRYVANTYTYNTNWCKIPNFGFYSTQRKFKVLEKIIVPVEFLFFLHFDKCFCLVNFCPITVI